MRICHFTEALAGGPASYLNNLLPWQIERYGPGSVYVAAPASQLHLLDVDDVIFLPLEYRPGRSLSQLFALRQQWNNILSSSARFDIIHLHSTFAGVIGRSVGTPAETSVIYCPHGWAFTMLTATWKKILFALVERVLAPRADALVAISQFELDAAIGVGISGARCRLVRNGIDVQAPALLQDCSKPGVMRILFVGRFDRQKGFDLLLQAMRRLDPNRFHLTAIGAYVVDRPAHMEPPPNVEIVRWQRPEFVRAAMRASDLLVVPSRWEAFGLVAVEAMREERTVAAARVGGLQEIVADRETGLLFEPNDAEALAAAIMTSAQLDLGHLGRNGRKRFERLFTAQRMAAELDLVYDHCMRNRREFRPNKRRSG